MVSEQQHNKSNIPAMMAKLDEIYEKEEKLLKQIDVFVALYQQLQEDKELLQNLIMYQSNKNVRIRQAERTSGKSMLDLIKGLR